MKLIDWLCALFIVAVAVLFIFKWVTEPRTMAFLTAVATCLAISFYLAGSILFPQPARHDARAVDGDDG